MAGRQVSTWVHRGNAVCVTEWARGNCDGKYNGGWWGLKMTETSCWSTPRGPILGSCVISSVWIGGRLRDSQAAGMAMLFSWLSGKRSRPSPVLTLPLSKGISSTQAVSGEQKIPPTPSAALPDAYYECILPYFDNFMLLCGKLAAVI